MVRCSVGSGRTCRSELGFVESARRSEVALERLRVFRRVFVVGAWTYGLAVEILLTTVQRRMMKSEYREWPETTEKFERGMKALFRMPKPSPKKREGNATGL